MIWNIHGVIPPIAENESGGSFNRSPYQIGIVKLIELFCFNQKRCSILHGFLRYRKKMYDMGYVDGFQWIDGSFCENCEVLRDRTPNDIDVVTFFNPESRTDNLPFDDSFFTRENMPNIKSQYFVDAYFMNIGLPADFYYTKMVAYWYSMWSHQTDTSLWKGFLCVNLSPQEDVLAMQILESKFAENGETNESESI